MSFRLRRLLGRLKGGKAVKAAVPASVRAPALEITPEDVEELYERRRRRKKTETVPPVGLAALTVRV